MALKLKVNKVLGAIRKARIARYAAAALAVGAAQLPAANVAQAACPDGTNRCLSRNHFQRVPGANNLRDFNDVGWGQNPHQGKGTKQAGPNFRQVDSYDAFPRLRYQQRGQFFNGRECVTVEGGNSTAGGTMPRRVVGRSPGRCETRLVN